MPVVDAAAAPAPALLIVKLMLAPFRATPLAVRSLCAGGGGGGGCAAAENRKSPLTRLVLVTFASVSVLPPPKLITVLAPDCVARASTSVRLVMLDSARRSISSTPPAPAVKSWIASAPVEYTNVSSPAPPQIASLPARPSSVS